MRRFRPISPALLVAHLVELFGARHPGTHPLRVALDAPRCADARTFASQLSEALTHAGRPNAVVDSAGFYRDASLRLEFGKTDVESYYSGWLDSSALQREVLAPLGTDRPHSYLPSLRDPGTNRSTRSTPIGLATNAVLVVHGELLLGIGLGFDVTIHLAVSRQARKRQTADEWQWTLPALDRYDIDVDPTGIADVVIRFDDAAHPAIGG